MTTTASTFPEIVCLCGSTRFYDEFQAANCDAVTKANTREKKSMPINPITMYYAVCDSCGEHIATDYVDYCSTTKYQVIDGLHEGDIYIATTGATYHSLCLPASICPESLDGYHHWDDDEMCVDCSVNVPTGTAG